MIMVMNTCIKGTLLIIVGRARGWWGFIIYIRSVTWIDLIIEHVI